MKIVGVLTLHGQFDLPLHGLPSDPCKESPESLPKPRQCLMIVGYVLPRWCTWLGLLWHGSKSCLQCHFGYIQGIEVDAVDLHTVQCSKPCSPGNVQGQKPWTELYIWKWNHDEMNISFYPSHYGYYAWWPFWEGKFHI